MEYAEETEYEELTRYTGFVQRRLPSGKLFLIEVPLYRYKGGFYKKQADVEAAINDFLLRGEEE